MRLLLDEWLQQHRPALNRHRSGARPDREAHCRRLRSENERLRAEILALRQQLEEAEVLA